MQATVFWELAYRVCLGLIEMMDSSWLGAKTWGRRMQGYTALHIASNGSDLLMVRGDLVRRLIQANAEVDVVDEEGRTPFLHACGTGVTDVAKALCQAGCDVHARSWDGRNAADRARGGSGSMRGCYWTNATISVTLCCAIGQLLLLVLLFVML